MRNKPKFTYNWRKFIGANFMHIPSNNVAWHCHMGLWSLISQSDVGRVQIIYIYILCRRVNKPCKHIYSSALYIFVRLCIANGVAENHIRMLYICPRQPFFGPPNALSHTCAMMAPAGLHRDVAHCALSTITIITYCEFGLEMCTARLENCLLTHSEMFIWEQR